MAIHIIGRLWRDREGAMGAILALFLTLSISLCAFAVDAGSLYLERRTAQGAADLAAVAAASDLTHAEQAARATLTANGITGLSSLTIVSGRYEVDPAVAHAQRFKAGVQPYNAVRLDMEIKGQLYFAKMMMSDPGITVSAIGTTDAQATFSIGSRLAAVQGGLANAILGALLGGNVTLTAMDYQSLLNADVKLLDFLSALATELHVTAGTYDEVLSSQATVGNVLRATAAAAAAGGQTAAAQAVSNILSHTSASASVTLGGLVDLGPFAHAEIGQGQSALAADLNVMSLVTAAASLANGNSQVAVNLGGTIPGLLSLTLNVAIGEPAQQSGWVAVGQTGATVHTAQTRFRLVAEVGGSGLLSGVHIRLPIYIELAAAEARLKSLTCQNGMSNPQSVIEARPGVVRAWIGDVAPGGLASFGTSVPVATGSIVQALLVRVTGAAYAEMSNTSSTDLPFSKTDVDGGVIKTAEVHDYLSSLTSSLLQSLNLNVNILGLGIGLSVPAIKTLVLAALTPVTAALDSLLVPLLQLAGVHLGQVDVQVNGMRCGSAVLAG